MISQVFERLRRGWPRANSAEWPVPLESTDFKLLGSALAWQRYHGGVAGPAAPSSPNPVQIDLGGRLCHQRDIEAAWLRHWCGGL